MVRKFVVPYQIDLRVGKFCLEINGPQHYLVDSSGMKMLDGISSLKKDLLREIGLVYVDLPYDSFSQAQDQRQAKAALAGLVKAQTGSSRDKA